MEPWTGVFDETLVRLDGEEDLAPRVLAMAGRRRWAEVQAIEVQMRGRRWKVAPIWVFSSTCLKYKLPVLLEIWNLYR